MSVLFLGYRSRHNAQQKPTTQEEINRQLICNESPVNTLHGCCSITLAACKCSVAAACVLLPGTDWARKLAVAASASAHTTLR
jgi:hypothetical protein